MFPTIGNYSLTLFQALETFLDTFPTIGSFRGQFSNRWKLFPRFFQSLEVFAGGFPIVGSFCAGFSNRWKTGIFLFLAAKSANGGFRRLAKGAGEAITKKAFFSRPPLFLRALKQKAEKGRSANAEHRLVEHQQEA